MVYLDHKTFFSPKNDKKNINLNDKKSIKVISIKAKKYLK